MTPDAALDQLRGMGDPTRAEGMAAYHKTERPCFGVSNPELNQMAMGWRRSLALDERVALASGLWDSDVFEARILAAKLLTQARIRPDDAVWALLQSWVPQFDGWALADHACSALSRRLVADPSRLDTVETWTKSDHLWTKRAALVATLPWCKQNFPTEAEQAARDRILGWAAGYVEDKQWFIQKSVAWWLRDLSRHDAPRARAFLDAHGAQMKPFARKEAGKYLAPPP